MATYREHPDTLHTIKETIAFGDVVYEDDDKPLGDEAMQTSVATATRPIYWGPPKTYGPVGGSNPVRSFLPPRTPAPDYFAAFETHGILFDYIRLPGIPGYTGFDFSADHAASTKHFDIGVNQECPHNFIAIAPRYKTIIFIVALQIRASRHNSKARTKT